MSQAPAEGIPSVRDYKEAIESSTFKKMEQYSDSFLSANRTILQYYAKKWIDDPLHQWSRQWEYPFVYSRVQQQACLKPQLRILDAGSGATFFPHFLNACFNNVNVHCCDYDKRLTSIFEQINAGKDKSVEFSTADLRELPYERESFDMVYCVSVLEHTRDYEKIIDQFLKILKPGGTLVVTFDISLDGTRDIDVDKATALLASLAGEFGTTMASSFNLHSLVSTPDILTTLTARDIDPALLPWNAPAFVYRIKSFITTGRLVSWPPPLTVFCLGLTR